MWSFVALQISLNVIIGPYQAIIPDLIPPQRFGVSIRVACGNGQRGQCVRRDSRDAPRRPMAWVRARTRASDIGADHVGPRPAPPHATDRNGRRRLRSAARSSICSSREPSSIWAFIRCSGICISSLRRSCRTASCWTRRGRRALCVLVFTVVGALGALVAAGPADRADERLVVSVGGSVVAASLMGLALVHQAPALAPAIAACGRRMGYFSLCGLGFCVPSSAARPLATTMAVWNLAVVGPQMLAPLVATLTLSGLGVIRNATGPRDALLLGGAEMLIGTLWIWRLPGAPRGHKAYGHDCMEPEQGEPCVLAFVGRLLPPTNVKNI